MSETTSDTAPTESPMFRAGWIAVERGWNDASLALPADLEDLAPTRPPLVVVASAADVTVHHSRTLAAVAGAGRNVMLVMFEGEINDDAMKWLGDRVEVVDLSRTCTTRTRRRQSVSPQRRRTVRRSDAARCLGQHHLGWQLLPTDLGRRERVGWRQQPPSATAPRQNHRHPASGGRQVRALLRGRDAEQSYRNDLLDRVLLGSYGGQDYLVIETPIGASDDPERVWTPPRPRLPSPGT